MSGRILQTSEGIAAYVHAMAGTYGLAGAIRNRGWALKTLSLLAPPTFAVLASWILLKEAGGQRLPGYIWFGTTSAMAGAAIGLLSGFSSRSVGGFAAGIIGGQIVAWPAGLAFQLILKSGTPFGLAYPTIFALGSGMTHLAIAYALRWAKADQVPPKDRKPPSSP